MADKIEVVQATGTPPLPQAAADAQASSFNIREHLKDPGLRIVPTCLFHRLVFEAKLRYALIKMATFAAYLACFFLVLQSILPSDEASAARRQLETVLGTADVGSVTSPDDVLTFAGGLARSLEARRATADAYWCQTHHLRFQWDFVTNATKRVCIAPHGVPLGYAQPEKWVAGRRLDDEHNHRAADDLTDSRRLADINDNVTDVNDNVTTSTITTTTSATTSSTTTTTTSECIDKDLLLAISLNETGATCRAKRASVCALDVGAHYCPVTCGLCPPFTYSRLKAFIGPGVAVTPLVLYRTRFASRNCDDWIQGRKNMMASGAKASFANSATMGAARGASLDTASCVDRKKHQKSLLNASYSVRGEKVEAQMLLRPDVDLTRMKALEWLDAFTDRAALLALVYTEGMEVFTLLSVEFSFDHAGNVESKIQSWTWKDLIGADKDHFIAREVLLLVIAGFAMAHTAAMLVSQASRYYRLFEVFTQGLLFFTSVGVVIWWSAQDEMGAKVGEALDAFLAVESPAQEADSSKALDVFFNSAEGLRTQAEGLNWLCMLCYMVASLQLVQLAVYFHEGHPRMAMLTATVKRALYELFHVAVLLVLLYIFFAFVLHWMFGRSLPESETLGQAMQSQLKMMYGEYIRLPGVTGLDDDAATAYWIHAVIFLVFAFFIIRFVFLAALVHSYAEVQASQSANGSESPRNFLLDAFDALVRPIRAASYHWPSEDALIRWMESGAVRDPLIRPAQLHTVFGNFLSGAKNHEATPVETFVEYLSKKVPEALVLIEGAGDPRFSRSQARATQVPTLKRGPSCITTVEAPGPGERKGSKGRESKANPTETLAQLEELVPLSRKSRMSSRGSGMNVKKVAMQVVHEVTSQLAQSDLSEVNWLTMTGKVSTTLYREFTTNGLIRHEASQAWTPMPTAPPLTECTPLQPIFSERSVTD